MTDPNDRHDDGGGRQQDERDKSLTEELRLVREEVRDFRRANRRSIWDGPAKLMAQFNKLFLPVVYLLGLLLFAVMVTAPQKLPWVDTDPSADHVAYIDIQGAIAKDKPASADRLIPAMEKALENEHSKGLVLRIDSPGGSPVQADRIYQAINELRDKYNKPIISVIGDIGASGAYYFASASDEIYANPNSLVGSIGVISSSWGLEGVMKRFDVEHRVFTSGRNKDMLSPYKPVTPEIREFWEGTLDHTHQVFIDRVKAGRGDRLDIDYPQLFSGLIWDGETAQRIGLIDGMGNLRTVATTHFDLDDTEDYTPAKPLGGLPGLLGINAQDVGQVLASMVSSLQAEMGGPDIRAQLGQ